MYNNYTIELLNPDKIATRQAEAEAQRRGTEGREGRGHVFGAPAGVERVVAFGASSVAAARRLAAAAGTGLQHLRGPRAAAGQHQI